jgi:Aspartyl protease
VLLRLFFPFSLVFAVVLLSPVRATEVPFEYRDGLLWLKVWAAGKREPLNFILDSGASTSVLSIQAARDLNMKLGSPQMVYGVHSKTVAYRIDGFEAGVAGITLPDSLLAVDLSGVSKTAHQSIDGLLGAEFFRGRVVQVDFASRKVRVLDNVHPNARGTVLPIKWRNKAICVPVGLAGRPARWMRLDTGCESALEWAGGGATAQGDAGPSIGLSSASIRYVSADVQLGSHKLSNVEVGIHPRRIFAGEGGLLGNRVLSQFRVTIDAPGRRVILEPTNLAASRGG